MRIVRFSGADRRRLVVAAAVAAAVGCGADSSESEVEPPVSDAAGIVRPFVTSDAVTDDPDDPAIWIHPTDPARSVVFATNKVAAPAGAVVAYGLDGRLRQTIAGLDRPNNIDVESGVVFGGRSVDIAVATERLQHRLRVFAIDAADGRLTDLATIPVLEGETGDRSEPMGIALYRRPADGAVFAIVAPKTGGRTGYLAQYRLTEDGQGRVTGTLVRRFGAFSDARNAEGEPGEIEAVVVDDELGFVYYADEAFGIHKWHADPEHADAARELAVFGTTGYEADREGLAIYRRADGTGYLVSTDQIGGGSVLKFYRREGSAGAPHDHAAPAFEVRTPSDSTDGIDVTSVTVPGAPGGFLVMMNSAAKNFLFFRWQDLEP